MIARLCLLSIVSAAFVSCTVMESKPVALTGTPVTWRHVSEIVDEEIVQHSVKFRNIGQQVVSFDYTLVDDAYVPHMDAAGPNSGLVENLYPGAEVQVKNPLKGDAVTVQVGRVTYGKRSSEQLAKTYKPWTITPASSASPAAGGILPLPEPPQPAPGE
ncbi:MAG: hypothetical protein HS117_25595 [Verrucomicrobiaceae bacterium]|jgi:hypothetical protein|nr:hypothetical protein [Verrucomicrobiaceae bacterium]